MKKGVCILLFLAFSAFPLGAQEEKPRVKIIPFTVHGLGTEEARIIESLIWSYIAALGDASFSSERGELFSFDPPEGEDPVLPVNDGRSPDYTLSGSITLERDSRILMLEIGEQATGEITYYTSAHKTTSELVLKIRSLIESAFSLNPGGPVRAEEPELLTEGGIAGTWRGDTGIEIIRLRRGGRGTAIFSSGAQMELSYSIDQNTLRVTQSSPNTERYYHPVPYGVAKQLVSDAEPMRWELLLYHQGTSLRGIKIATAVRYEGNTILELLPASAREAEWTRTIR
jgi:hypothetical protein